MKITNVSSSKIQSTQEYTDWNFYKLEPYINQYESYCTELLSIPYGLKRWQRIIHNLYSVARKIQGLTKEQDIIIIKPLIYYTFREEALIDSLGQSHQSIRTLYNQFAQASLSLQSKSYDSQEWYNSLSHMNDLAEQIIYSLKQINLDRNLLNSLYQKHTSNPYVTFNTSLITSWKQIKIQKNPHYKLYPHSKQNLATNYNFTFQYPTEYFNDISNKVKMETKTFQVPNEIEYIIINGTDKVLRGSILSGDLTVKFYKNGIITLSLIQYNNADNQNDKIFHISSYTPRSYINPDEINIWEQTFSPTEITPQYVF